MEYEFIISPFDFKAIAKGDKTYLLTNDFRDFQVGDFLILRVHTLGTMFVRISYIEQNLKGLADGYRIIEFKPAQK